MLSLSQFTNGASFVAAQYSHTGMSDLNVAVIDPSWIIAGSPVSRIKLLHEAPDTRYAVALWDCTAGTFRWYFGYDEVVHILEGEVTIREDNGTERTLRAGDIAMFPKGATNVWKVDSYVRKIAINRYHRATPIELVKRMVRRGSAELKRLLGQDRPEQQASGRA
jgi:uncharacterized cupin superfamily protein